MHSLWRRVHIRRVNGSTAHFIAYFLIYEYHTHYFEILLLIYNFSEPPGVCEEKV